MSPTLAVEALDNTLLEVLEAILPLLQATTWDRKRKRNINGAIEQFKSARATKGKTVNEDAWMKNASCLVWSRSGSSMDKTQTYVLVCKGAT